MLAKTRNVLSYICDALCRNAWPPEGLGSRTLLMYAGSHATQAADNALATIG